MRKLSFYLVFGLVSLSSLIITGLITLNAYELAFHRDIPLSGALSRISIDAILATNGGGPDYFDQKREGNFGQPIQLKIPSTNSRFEIIPGILGANNRWLARANSGHYLFMSGSKSGNLGDTIIYLKQSWRTVNRPEQIKVGENLFLDTDKGWRYMFRINEVGSVKTSSGYVIDQTTTTKLVIVISNADQQTNTIINADFVTIQNIQR